jgi:hypothetical protein
MYGVCLTSFHMANKPGRPPIKRKRVKMSFRFRPEFAQFIRRKARQWRVTQTRVLEKTLTVNSKGRQG